MAFFTPQLQIVSDLHLETPISKPRYLELELDVIGTALFLLGDIGLVKDDGLLAFLRRLLKQNRGCRIFYVLGNHEPYQTTLENGVTILREFEREAKHEYGGRFHFLHRDRYDLTPNLTILGCTLWTSVQSHQAAEILSRLTDFNETRGIHGWTLEQSCDEHAKDLAWLNKQIQEIQAQEPEREIMIATHHCPTTDPRATAPVHQNSTINSAFVSDLSHEPCWTAPAVKLWAFGHTHYNCTFRDENTGKLLVSNQKGYSGIGHQSRGVASKLQVKIVEPQVHEWRVSTPNEASRAQHGSAMPTTTQLPQPESREATKTSETKSMEMDAGKENTRVTPTSNQANPNSSRTCASSYEMMRQMCCRDSVLC